MLILHLTALFRVGDRAGCTINGHPAEVYWRDPSTLVLNGSDVRSILVIERGGIDGAGRPIVTFTCADAAAEPDTAF